jgi:hypothetical protein
MKPKGVEAQAVVDQFHHHTLHSDALLRLYPDLTIVADGTTVDYFDFLKESTTTYLYIHSVRPYKNIQINCLKCDGVVRVNSHPFRIPIFLEHEIVYNKEYNIYSFVYEDLIKAHNFSAKTLAETQLYILSKLEEHTKNNHKIDFFTMSNSIKRLLPFA